jgi:hypothetical protein
MAKGVWPAARAVLVRPWLWPIAARQARRTCPRGWWRRPPFVPVPDPAYLGFRLETQYGARDVAPVPADLVAFLEWCRTNEREARRGARATRR